MSLLNKLKRMANKDNKPSNQTPLSSEQSPAEKELALYSIALESERAQKDAYFRTSPYSPLTPDIRQKFSGLNYYPPRLEYRLVLSLEPVPREAITIETSTQDQRTYYRYGKVRFNINDEPAELTIYQAEDDEHLFLPFRDKTSGKETYGAGRYLEPEEVEPGQILLDFNLAYNPFCAYSSNYSCPLPPLENWLKIPVFAGEMNFVKPETHD